MSFFCFCYKVIENPSKLFLSRTFINGSIPIQVKTFPLQQGVESGRFNYIQAIPPQEWKAFDINDISGAKPNNETRE